MQVTLEKNYPVAANVAAAWTILSDIRELASCMPGATITDQINETQYKGAVKLKVGPATAAFAGEITVLEVEQGQYLLRMIGKGADKGGSSASMELTANLIAIDGSSCTLAGKADVIVNGKFAQFGGRMMTSVSDMILQQFAANFSAKAAALNIAAPAANDAHGHDHAHDHGHAHTHAAPPVAPAIPTELNVLAIGWGLIRNFFAGLFGRRS
jgi:carbon monoxide dehydrogenase subunit G